MLPRTDIGVTAVARTEAIVRLEGVADARQQAFQRTMASLLGQPLQGKILSKLTDGSYVVELAGASARMLLPPGAQVGAQVPMTLVSLTPRPTFQISAEGAQAALVHAEAMPASTLPADPAAARAAAALQQLAQAPLPGQAAQLAHAALPPGQAQAGNVPLQAGAAQAAATAQGKAGLPGTAPDAELAARQSAPATLSPTARVLSGVLGLAMASPHSPSAIVAPAPLMPAAGAPPAQLAAALQQAVARSGLFYESHVAEWAAGQRSMADLATEPQMQRSAASTPLLADDSQGAQLINLQLQTQEQARVAWQGQAWPGQNMRWEIQRDDGQPQAHGEDEAPQPGWRSSLNLRFELLGEIGARLFMAGDQVQLQLDAGDSAIGELLRARAGELGAALEAAGIALASLTVRGPQADPHE